MQRYKWAVMIYCAAVLCVGGFFYIRTAAASERAKLYNRERNDRAVDLSRGRQEYPLLVSGVVSQDEIAVLNAFADYLSENAGYPLRIMAVASYTHLTQALQENPTALGWVCGLPYVQDRQSLNLQLVAVPLFNGKPTYESWVIARRGRPEKRLREFRGAVFGYSDIRSNSGYLAPQYALARSGIDINTFFSKQVWCRNHVGSIEAVMAGLVDVAAVDEYIYLQYRKTHPDVDKQVQILQRFGPFPFTPIVAGEGVPPEMVARLKKALQGMPQTEQGRRLLEQMGLDGFVEVEPEFYRPIEQRWRYVQKQVGG